MQGAQVVKPPPPPEHNEDNCEKLADAMIDSWDDATVRKWASDELYRHLLTGGVDQFDHEWTNHYDPDA